MAHTPTAEQQAVIDFVDKGKGNLLVQALAGSAKTTTLEMAAAWVQGEALALAFNKKIAVALAEKLPSNFTCKTFNSIGHSAWAKTVGKRLKLDTGKMRRLCQPLAPVGPERDKLFALANAAKTCGLVPEGPRHIGIKRFVQDTQQGWDHLADFCGIIDATEEDFSRARTAVLASIEESYAGTIDFSDQIYQTACFSGALPRFPMIFVDEAQDLSAMQHYMLRKMVSGRIVCVGDRYQAIYAFRGAESTSMDMLAEQFNCTILPLTICFRCSKAVVEHAQQFTPEMRSPDWAIPGDVSTLGRWSFDDIQPDSFVLCRNNAPLVKLAFAALAEGRSIKFNGREIGLRVIRFAESVDGERGLERNELLGQCALAVSELPLAKQETASEVMEVLRAVPGENTKEILANLDRLLIADSGNITFSSIHRSKGLEAPTTYILDRHRMPSPYAKSEKQLQQEANLHYVAVTRAQRDLYYISMDLWKETI